MIKLIHVECGLIPIYDVIDGQAKLLELRHPKTSENMLHKLPEDERLQAELSLQYQHEEEVLEESEKIQSRRLSLGQYRSPRTGV